MRISLDHCLELRSTSILHQSRPLGFALLCSVVTELIVPDAVYNELVIPGSERADAPTMSQAFWISLRPVKDRAFLDTLPHKLHLGEREAIGLAKELGAVLLVDEREARKEAHRLGVPYFGSLRILKEVKDRGLAAHIKPILDDLLQSGTYISSALYKEFLRQMGEG